LCCDGVGAVTWWSGLPNRNGKASGNRFRNRWDSNIRARRNHRGSASRASREGYGWQSVYHTDTDFLPLTRYTIPNKIVGRDLSTENNDTYFSSAFVLSEPFICHRYHVMQSKYTNKNLKRYLSLYESNPNLYLAGQYVYRRGLSDTIPTRVDVGVIEGADGTCSAIQLYNTSTVGQARVTFTYTPPSGKVTRAYNAETGESLLTADGSISVTLNNQETISVIVEY